MAYDFSVPRRDPYHNGRLAAYCQEGRVPLVDIASVLRDERFADALHPTDAGARVIAHEGFRVLTEIRQAWTPGS